MEEDREFGAPPITGTQVQYFVVCPRKCWLFVHGLEQETESDWVELGRLTHEQTFARQQLREVNVGGFIQIDFTDEGIVHEVKHGRRMEHAHRLQVAYYLYQLRERGVQTSGVLHYPNQRRKETVELTPELEQELMEVLEQIRQLREQPLPPQVDEPMSICRRCAYEEFCWCEDEEEVQP